MREVRLAIASERRERATRTEHAGEAACERACGESEGRSPSEEEERVREVLVGLPHDLRFALRTTRKSALVSATIVLCLGFSIGATGTVFAWMETLVLQPLTGVKGFDRLVSLKTTTAHDED